MINKNRATQRSKEENTRHNPLECTWLSSRPPFHTIEPVIGPDMKDEENKELEENSVEERIILLKLTAYQA